MDIRVMLRDQFDDRDVDTIGDESLARVGGTQASAIITNFA